MLWWRSVGHTHTAFAMETMIDELVVRARMDLFAYHRKLLKPEAKKLSAALDLLKAKSITWWRRLPKNHALGIACHENSRLLLSRPAIIGFEQYRPRSSKNACDSPDSGK